MKPIPSSYYPPRARSYSRLLGGRFTLRRMLRLEDMRVPDGISFPNLLLSLVLPGYALSACGKQTLGRLVLTGYGLASLAFAAALGHALANLLFGLMISSHVTSILYLLNRWAGPARFWVRLALPLIILFAVSQLIYLPLLRQTEEHWVMPMRVGDRVIVVNRMAPATAVGQGDYVAHTISEIQGNGLFMREGYGINQVLAMAGDEVRFTPESVEVNGRAYPLQPHMPKSGRFTVPKNSWFVWPTLAIRINGNVPEASLTSALLRTAMVSESQYLGRPFHHWFGRRQALP